MKQRRPIETVESNDYPEIVDVWEASVRATHHFLKEEDILHFKPLILNEYLDLVTLHCMRAASGRIIGFSGVADGKLEMLFIHPDWRGKGIGKQLLEHAIYSQHARAVDVNEQNPQAVGFYQHLGFVVKSRSALDGQGNPYPLLHMTFED